MRTDNGWTVETTGGSVTGSWLLGADGATGIVRKHTFRPFARDQLSVAAGCFVEGVSVWTLVSGELAASHERFRIRGDRDAAARLDLPHDRVPQLRLVSASLDRLTGFRVAPVPGLVPTRDFYGSLADRTFCSTQIIRHHSVPLYTPEPDVVHELVGHCNMLASPVFAELYQLAGEASRRAESDAALEFFCRGLLVSLSVRQAGGAAYGAGLLSSFGELDAFHDAQVRPFDVTAMGTTDYDITVYQPVLYAGRSVDHVVDQLGTFLSTYDDDAFGPPHRPSLLTRAPDPPGSAPTARPGGGPRRRAAAPSTSGAAASHPCDDPAPDPVGRPGGSAVARGLGGRMGGLAGSRHGSQRRRPPGGLPLPRRQHRHQGRDRRLPRARRRRAVPAAAVFTQYRFAGPSVTSAAGTSPTAGCRPSSSSRRTPTSPTAPSVTPTRRSSQRASAVPSVPIPPTCWWHRRG